VNVADEGCVTVVEHQLLNTDMTFQEVKQEQNLNVPSFVSIHFNGFLFFFVYFQESRVLF
jgi:hypothetical protein